MPEKRFLTKSRFKLALECPVKLYYTGKPEYPDTKNENTFLAALAEGGFQVGALAKLYFPGGIEITEKSKETQLKETNELLKRENVIIFEAAFCHKNLFIRADIIVKKGNTIQLIEVKSKSFRDDDSGFLNNKGYLIPGWKPYLYDIAFQKHVVLNSHPGFKVIPYLLLADKSKKTTVDGLNQKFFLSKRNGNRPEVEILGDVTLNVLGKKILTVKNVDDIVNDIFSGSDSEKKAELSFARMVEEYADHYENDKPYKYPIGAQCQKCEFTCPMEKESATALSGFRKCWKEQLGWNDNMFREPLLFEVWDFRRKQTVMDEGVYFMKDLTKSHIENSKPSEDERISRTDRQWLQVERTISKNKVPYLDIDGLRNEMKTWKYPLHFIDFETSMVAIPFHNGRKPYEGIAFQFSHHTVDKNGVIKHAGEFINVKPGVFPNFEFIRELKKQLENDEGTIFRYADHENTFLTHIYRQLNTIALSKVPDKEELIEFIKSISHSPKESVEKWKGKRDMTDMLKFVKAYFYQVDMKGSNSIKVVLPTVLKCSSFLKNKYSKPVYGAEGGIESRNFTGKQWYVTDENGNVTDPYKLLDPVFKDIDQSELEDVSIDESIADGGAAMTAYARMQFTRMGDVERALAENALLRYCELDTFAMVMIWEYWNDRVKNSN